MPPLRDSRRESFAIGVAMGKPVIKTYLEVWRGDAKLPATSVSQKANRISTNPEVRNRIAEIRAQMATRTAITAQQVLEELAKIGFANAGDMIRIGEDGTTSVDLSELTPDQKAAIQEIDIVTNPDGKQKIKVKLHDKRAALMDIGKHLGMFREKVEVSGPDGGPIQTASAIEVSLLNREERGMLKEILLAIAERKAAREREESMTIEHRARDAEF